MIVRCQWAEGSQIYRDYHDNEWGKHNTTVVSYLKKSVWKDSRQGCRGLPF